MSESNLLDAMEQDATEREDGIEGIDAEAIARVARLAQRQFDIEREIDELKARTTTLREEAEKIARNDLPEAMMTANMQNFTLGNGAAVTLHPDLYISIPAPKRDEALAWLEENGHGGIIKCAVETVFPAGHEEEAETLAYTLIADGYKPKIKRDVHAQTLRKWARQESQSGRSVPDGLFRCFEFVEAKIRPSG